MAARVDWQTSVYYGFAVRGKSVAARVDWQTSVYYGFAGEREERGCQSRLAEQRRTGRADRRLTLEGYEYIVLAGPFGLKNW